MRTLDDLQQLLEERDSAQRELLREERSVRARLYSDGYAHGYAAGAESGESIGISKVLAAVERHIGKADAEALRGLLEKGT